MVTFLLIDSFPVNRRVEWERILCQADDSLKRRRLEDWLDRGYGECWLRHRDVAEAVEQVLLEANGSDFQMQAWVIMQNHVHLVVDVWEMPLSKLVGVWKGKSARLANVLLGRRGRLWQEDYFDTLIRDGEHLKKAVRYTEQNPVKAKLVKDPRDWLWSSAHQRDEYGRLPWQRET